MILILIWNTRRLELMVLTLIYCREVTHVLGIHHSLIPSRLWGPSECRGPALSGPPVAVRARWGVGGGGVGCLSRLEYAALNILKVYRIVPKSEVACPKKDSITASNWGRFLPALQIKLPLTWFVLGGLCPTHQAAEKHTPHSTNNTNLSFLMHTDDTSLLN